MTISHARVSAQAASFALTWCCVQIACAQMSLDKLTDCEDLANTHDAVEAWVDRAPKNCSSPRNVIGRAILERSHIVPSAICFLRDAPSTALSGFNCFAIQSVSSAQLICYRPTQLSDVRNYKSQFSGRYDLAAVEYMRKAAKCARSGGDTSVLPLVTYPYPLMFVSRSEFGFIGNLKGGARDGHVVHAFARVDPSLRAAPDAIEVFSLSVGGTIKKQDPTNVHRANGWRAFIQVNDEMDQQFNKYYKEARVPVRIHSINIELSRPTDFSGLNKNRIESIHADLVRRLKAEGFEEQDLDEVKLSDGRTFADAFDEMKESATPFGMRRVYSLSDRQGPVVLLINAKRPSCVQGDRGVFMALVGADKPDPNEKSDYGAASLMIAGLGACAHFSGSTRRYADGLLADAEKGFLQSLELGR